MDASTAVRYNFASRIFPHDELLTEVLKIAKKAAKSSPIALEKSKRLMRDHVRDELKRVSLLEMDLLIERMTSNESLERVKGFLAMKSKI